MRTILAFLLSVTATLPSLSQNSSEKLVESRELATTSSPSVFMKSGNYTIFVTTWNENKVKLEAEAAPTSGTGKTTSLFETYAITLFGSESVQIQADPEKAVADSLPIAMRKGSARKLSLRLYLPEKAALVMETRFSEIVIGASLVDARFRLLGGSLSTSNIGRLQLTAELAAVHMGRVGTAQIELNTGATFYGGSIQTLNAQLKNAQLDYEAGSFLYMKGALSKIRIGAIDTLIADITSGTLTINRVTQRLEAHGRYMDLFVADFLPSTQYIELVNSYGEARLPLTNLVSWNLNFEGNFSRVQAPLGMTVPEIPPGKKVEKKSVDEHFVPYTFSFGKGSGKRTPIKILCDACKLDFR